LPPLQSQNPQRSPATPAVLLNQGQQIRPKSERKTWYIGKFRVPNCFHPEIVKLANQNPARIAMKKDSVILLSPFSVRQYTRKLYSQQICQPLDVTK
jgi:hypothetical protein